MKSLLLLNGSPRGERSNSMKMLSRVGEGWERGGGKAPEILHLARRPGFDRAVEAFAAADVVMLGMPLYTDAMPALVKAYIEALGPARSRHTIRRCEPDARVPGAVRLSRGAPLAPAGTLPGEAGAPPGIALCGNDCARYGRGAPVNAGQSKQETVGAAANTRRAIGSRRTLRRSGTEGSGRR